ncbi:hypothetical protein SM757_24800 [Azohydromonas lata]|uniref:Flagellar hook-length control protein FliK n=1 Tax=Azohydromonas lata TaxID=45677 RepID=A0ABU5ILP7_9BURK|nr:hypothetical protein [Azohydromonas lata]MDZ5459804.1 hypothetical protein [Azohydromonas lata]
MQIAGSSLQPLLTQASGPAPGVRETQRSVDQRSAMATTAGQASVSVHISAAGRVAAAVMGTAGLAATARTQGTAHALSVDSHGRSHVTLAPQSQAIRRIVEQMTGKQIGAFNTVDLGALVQTAGGAAAAQASASGESAAAAQVISQLNALLQFSASGMVTAQDGAKIGFTVLMELEDRAMTVRSLKVRINQLGMAPPEVSYDGPASDLAGHAFTFDLGQAASEGQEGPQIFGSGVVAFEDIADPAASASA